jgi:hypothetical protein
MPTARRMMNRIGVYSASIAVLTCDLTAFGRVRQEATP